MHVLCHFNIRLLKFALQVYDVFKHMYKQFTFFCFGEVLEELTFSQIKEIILKNISLQKEVGHCWMN